MTIEKQSPISKKNIFSLPSEIQDCFNLLILAFFYGSYFLLGIILTYNFTEGVEHDEFSLFVQGWIFVPVLTIFAIMWIHKFKETTFPKDSSFIPILLGINTLFGLYLVWHLTHSTLSLAQSSLRLFIAFPVVQVMVLWGLVRFRNSPILLKLAAFESALYRLIPAGVGIILVMFSGLYAANYPEYSLPFRSILIAIPFGFLAYTHKYLMRPSGKKDQIILDVLAITLIIGACFDPNIFVDNHHENFYIGPINALLHGKTMLVDVYSQYGVLVHEFLALFFKLNLLPLNYQGLAFLVAIFSIFQYSLVYFLCRTLLKSPKFSLLILSTILLLNLFASMGVVQAYPSTGPVRFGLCYILITFIALRLKYPARKSIFLWLEYVTLGLASIWSFETFIYTGTIFFGIRGYEIITTTKTFGDIFKKIALVLLKSILVLSVLHSIQALSTLLRTGMWPHWIYYFEFIYTYSLAGFGGLPVDAWSPWFIIVSIYFICLIYPFVTWIITKEWDLSPETQIILCFAFFGVAQFTYYLGRSHPNNLFHISLPAILIVGYGISRITASNRKRYYRLRYRSGYGASPITRSENIKYKGAGYMSIFIAYATMAFLCFTYFPSFTQKISDTGFPFAFEILKSQDAAGAAFQQIHDRLWNPGPVLLETLEATDLVKKYAPDKTRVMIFLSPSEATTETLFLSKKANLYPITEQRQDGYSARISNLVINYSPELQIGDIVFLPAQPEMLILPFDFAGDNYTYPLVVVLKVCSKFDLSEIEQAPSGATAFRLEAHGSGRSSYCAKIKKNWMLDNLK